MFEFPFVPTYASHGTNVWLCRPCDAYVGTNGNSNIPLGTLAKQELRELRKQTHRMIDVYWKEKRMTRSEMYKRIQRIMNLTEDEAHVGKFNVEQCQTLMEHVRNGAFQ